MHLGVCDCLDDHPCIFRSKQQWWGFWQQWQPLFLAGSLKESSRWVTLCCCVPAVWPRPSSPPCCKVCLSGVLPRSFKWTNLTISEWPQFCFQVVLSFKGTVNNFNQNSLSNFSLRQWNCRFSKVRRKSEGKTPGSFEQEEEQMTLTITIKLCLLLFFVFYPPFFWGFFLFQLSLIIQPLPLG